MTKSIDLFAGQSISKDKHRSVCHFDLRDIEQQKKCFHWTNLQPLWADDNWRKGAKLIA